MHAAKLSTATSSSPNLGLQRMSYKKKPYVQFVAKTGSKYYSSFSLRRVFSQSAMLLCYEDYAVRHYNAHDSPHLLQNSFFMLFFLYALCLSLAIVLELRKNTPKCRILNQQNVFL